MNFDRRFGRQRKSAAVRSAAQRWRINELVRAAESQRPYSPEFEGDASERLQGLLDRLVA